MIAYFFRTIDEDGDTTGYMGFAMAHDREGLFWAIDEFCDPNMVEIKNAYKAGFCWKEGERIAYDEYDDDSQHEKAEVTPMIDDTGWRKPNWSCIDAATRAVVNFLR